MSKQEPTFDDLCCYYRTGRSFTISGTGKYRTYGYRHGIQCKLGDIERDQWIQMMLALIEQAGETTLHEHLLNWYKEHNYTRSSPDALALEALIAHSHRIFDNPRWLYYIPFNTRFRPAILQSAESHETHSTISRSPAPAENAGASV